MEDYERNTRILKLDVDQFTNELAASTNIDLADIIVWRLKITIKLYDKGVIYWSCIRGFRLT